MARPNKDIASTCSISEYTVKHHLANIYEKLGVYNRVELVLFAINRGLCVSPAAVTTQVEWKRRGGLPLDAVSRKPSARPPPLFLISENRRARENLPPPSKKLKKDQIGTIKKRIARFSGCYE